MMHMGDWQFDFSQPMLWVSALLLALSFLITLRFLVTRLYPGQKRRLALIVFVNLCAYATIAVLLVQPGHRQPVDDDITLLTEGFDPRHVPANGRRLYRLDETGADHTVDHPDSRNLPGTRISDIGQLPIREPGLSRIHLHGYGLQALQWSALPGEILVDFDPPLVDGFIDTRWQTTIVAGEALQVSGKLAMKSGDGIAQIRLLDPAGNTIDTLNTRHRKVFMLQAQPKARGLLSYTLQAWVKDTLIAEETVPVAVNASSPLSITIIQSAPSYETRQLKDFAAIQGHQVTVSTQTSKERFIRQSTRVETPASNDFALLQIEDDDILILDSRTIGQLDERQTDHLLKAINTGLGILILADSNLLEHSGNRLLEGFTPTALPGAATTVVPRLLTDGKGRWESPLPVTALSIGADRANVMIDDGQNRPLVAWRQHGLGRIGISLLTRSDQWLRSGYRADWEQLWSSLIASLAKAPETSRLLALPQTLKPRVNHQLALCALSEAPGLRVSVTSLSPHNEAIATPVSLSQDRLGSVRQCGYHWPQQPGWQRIRLMAAESERILDEKYLFVFDRPQWLADERNQRVRDTRTIIATQAEDDSVQSTSTFYRPLNPFWPWLFLVICASILWLEQKLTSTAGGKRGPAGSNIDSTL